MSESEASQVSASWMIEVLQSNQDTLLHKVKRNEAVRLQLEVNRAAIQSLHAAAVSSAENKEGR